MVSGRCALGLTGVATLLLLVPPEVLSHDSAPQNSPSSRQSDPGRPQRQGREQKAREITRDATVLRRRAAASRLDSAEAMQLLIDAATRIESLAVESAPGAANPAADPALLPDEMPYDRKA